MNHMDQEIKAFVYERFPAAKSQHLSDKDSILDTGVVDSLGIFEIVNYLVETHGIDIDEDDLVPENFDSIAAIVQFADRKKQNG